MKKSPSKGVPVNRVDADEILPEYGFKRGSPNKFASRYAAGSAVVVLEPDVAAAFPSSGEANEACAHWRESYRNIVTAGQLHGAVFRTLARSFDATESPRLECESACIRAWPESQSHPKSLLLALIPSYLSEYPRRSP
jgi:hypothetical protein